MTTLILAVAGLQHSVCPVFAEDLAQKARRPNIVLILADDLGYGDVGYLGNKDVRTPELDRMAREAVVFDNFYSAASVCSPTRAAMLTGRTPNRSGVFSWGWSLRPEEITLAEILKQAGYATGHFGKWHLGSVSDGSATSPGARLRAMGVVSQFL
ncbi:MAG: sulfatase-like hydrolase/transferase [Pirellulales bacterium]